MLIITLEGCVNCCLRMHRVEKERERDELSVPDRRRVKRGGMVEEREEGDITKLHLKLGLSPVGVPSLALSLSLSLSLAFLGGFGAQARSFNGNEKESAASRR